MKFSKLFFLAIFYFVFAPIVFADVALFTFTTDPQSIDQNALSKDITIQSQSSPGVSQAVPETTDLVFTSTSATGQFLNSSGNAVSTTMAKNSANRTFYYRDSSSGDFVLTVKATLRTSGQTFSASQHIFVGQPVTGSTATSTGGTATTTSNSNNTTSGDTSAWSAHSAPTDLSNGKEKLPFEISAGRDRLTSVGSEIMFQAVVTQGQDSVVEKAVGYVWSFGDGTTGTGENPTHIYKFPGEYAVVVNASFIDIKAVARTNVKVIDPKLSISRVSGGLEIYNNSNAEINLGGWSLVGGSRKFIFPKDTLIANGKKITVSDEVTGINLGNVELQSPISRTYSKISDIPLAVASTSEMVEQVTQNTIKEKPIASTVQKIVPKVKNIVENNSILSTSTKNTQTASAVTIFSAPQETHVLSSVFLWPFTFVRHIFSGN